MKTVSRYRNFRICFSHLPARKYPTLVVFAYVILRRLNLEWRYSRSRILKKAVPVSLTKLKTRVKRPLTITLLFGFLLIAVVAAAVHGLLDWQVQNSIRKNADI